MDARHAVDPAPISDLISVPFQENANFNVGRLDKTQSMTNIQPVVPQYLVVHRAAVGRDWALASTTRSPAHLSQGQTASIQDATRGLSADCLL